MDLYTDLKLQKLWNEFADIPINEDETIDCDFHQFEKGTYKEEIWHSFDEHQSRGLYILMGLEK